ncbi:MAG: M42 family metallopeptidase [Alicyclobacillus sp.]|nr:M42 family metallopeptidase [Alicyclobacillus sp.]
MLLKRLTEAAGPSGFEDAVRDLLRAELDGAADCMYTDVLGTLYVEQNRDRSGPLVMLDAHMDEVGLMVVHVEDNGLLRFRTIGGIDPRVLVSKPVRIGRDGPFGVIGSKPLHLQDGEERKHPLSVDQLYIDIGARDKDDALRAVEPGDVAVFATQYGEIGENCAKAKSFDDRVGCAVLVETLRRRLPARLVGAFTVQEEIGLRGATVAGHRVAPDIAIALEGTVCADPVGAPGHTRGTVLGAGPALTVQDGQTLADQRFLEFMMRVARDQGIPFQLRQVKGGSNDFGAIHKTRAGVTGGGISVPVRYIHAPAQIISLEDYHNTIRLVAAVVEAIAEGGFAR